MRTALDADLADLELGDHELLERVRNFGWTAINVFEEEGSPGFSYTLGFWHTLGVPDIIVFSLPDDVANSIFSALYAAQKKGRRFTTGQPEIDVLENDIPVMFFPVATERFEDHLTFTRWFHVQKASPAVQLVWPTRELHWPWNPSVAEDMKDIQPSMVEGGWPAAL